MGAHSNTTPLLSFGLLCGPIYIHKQKLRKRMGKAAKIARNLVSSDKDVKAFLKGKKVAQASGFPIWKTDLTKQITILAKVVPTNDGKGYVAIPQSQADFGPYLTTSSVTGELVKVIGAQFEPEDDDELFPVVATVIAAQYPLDVTEEEVTARYKDTPNGAATIRNWKKATDEGLNRFCVVSLEEVEYENWD